MKKLILATLILSLGTSVFAKEIIQQPVVEEVQEEVVEIAPVEAVVEPVKEQKRDTHIYFKAGANLISRYSEYKDKGLYGDPEQKITKGKTKGFGYELAIEGTKDVTDNLEMGLGIAYQNNNEFKKYSYMIEQESESTTFGKYNSVPVYLTGKYNFNTDSNWKPYIKANLGYSFNIQEKDVKNYYENGRDSYKLKVKNGVYAGIGTGVEYDNFLVDLTYSVNYAKATIHGDNAKTKSQRLDYGRIVLSVGYKLDI
ncbi:Outer membrane protein beta-barrel domain-containing protein [Cetobacterium ceti]|uniref:Outer membrane protein beta-barrel domain-containing protein n=1 Tax=Cetobacterium ceti TaxID=180163 RepID=A0A1T4QTF0_9FUSO|nr:outer membrane beta-barrel protein [Cetobacterium ceti]SKA07059.1 Outer membrane protein beta-barrel domain-containing protein [Cetobacterium ceti]